MASDPRQRRKYVIRRPTRLASSAARMVPKIAPNADAACAYDEPSCGVNGSGASLWDAFEMRLLVYGGACCTDPHVPRSAMPLRQAPKIMRRYVGRARWMVTVSGDSLRARNRCTG